eukprot:6485954-Amphidinium_carterae.1
MSVLPSYVMMPRNARYSCTATTVKFIVTWIQWLLQDLLRAIAPQLAHMRHVTCLGCPWQGQTHQLRSGFAYQLRSTSVESLRFRSYSSAGMLPVINTEGSVDFERFIPALPSIGSALIQT